MDIDTAIGTLDLSLSQPYRPRLGMTRSVAFSPLRLRFVIFTLPMSISKSAPTWVEAFSLIFSTRGAGGSTLLTEGRRCRLTTEEFRTPTPVILHPGCFNSSLL